MREGRREKGREKKNAQDRCFLEKKSKRFEIARGKFLRRGLSPSLAPGNCGLTDPKNL
jgi:hypothetical protein